MSQDAIRRDKARCCFKHGECDNEITFAPGILRKCNIRVRFCHNKSLVENLGYPQLLGRNWKIDVENPPRVWRVDIFLDDISKIAVDKSGENSGKPVEGLVKTFAQICNNSFTHINIEPINGAPVPAS